MPKMSRDEAEKQMTELNDAYFAYLSKFESIKKNLIAYEDELREQQCTLTTARKFKKARGLRFPISRLEFLFEIDALRPTTRDFAEMDAYLGSIAHVPYRLLVSHGGKRWRSLLEVERERG